jgi:hypothetical protein
MKSFSDGGGFLWLIMGVGAALDFEPLNYRGALGFNASVRESRRRRNVRLGWRDASPRLRCDRITECVRRSMLKRCVRIVYYNHFPFFGAFLLINFRPVSFVYDMSPMRVKQAHRLEKKSLPQSPKCCLFSNRRSTLEH